MEVARLAAGLGACMLGFVSTRIADLEGPLRDGKGTTPNKTKMAAAIIVHQTGGKGSLGELAVEVLDAILSLEEAEGPNAKEQLCPDSHEGMYESAEAGIIEGGIIKARTGPVAALAWRQVALTGQKLRVRALVADPWLDVSALPGERANNPAGPARVAATCVQREIALRTGFWSEGVDPRHRGLGERRDVRPLEKQVDVRKLAERKGNRMIFEGAALWWRQILSRLSPPDRERLLDAIHPDGPLPKKLRTPLVVHRWDGGTLAYLVDPGEERRAEWLTHGSFSARRDEDRVEDATTSVLCRWGARPGASEVEAIFSWRSAPPAPPPGATMTVVGG